MHEGVPVNNGDEREVIEGILCSAYSIILEKLLQIDNELATDWLEATALGMALSPEALAKMIYMHNQRRQGHVWRPGND